MKYTTIVAVPLVFLSGMLGCSKTEEPPENLKLLAALRTAISSQNAEWLAQTETAVDEATEKGELSEETEAAVREILALASDGEWEEAEKEIIRLQESRRPAANAAVTAHSHDHADHDH